MNRPLTASSVIGATIVAMDTSVGSKMRVSKSCRTSAPDVATNAPQPRPSTSSERGSGS